MGIPETFPFIRQHKILGPTFTKLCRNTQDILGIFPSIRQHKLPGLTCNKLCRNTGNILGLSPSICQRKIPGSTCVGIPGTSWDCPLPSINVKPQVRLVPSFEGISRIVPSICHVKFQVLFSSSKEYLGNPRIVPFTLSLQVPGPSCTKLPGTS